MLHLLQIQQNNKMNQKKHKSKIGHSLQQLEDGLILTLQDKPVLLNGNINQQDDVLENYEKRIQNEAEHNKQLKEKLKIIANAASSHLQAKNQGTKGLLPHYDDYRYKSDEIDLEDGNIIKASRPKPNKNIPSDYEPSNNLNTQYYERNTKFKQRKRQRTNNADLINFLNQTALQKQDNNQEQIGSATDLIQQSLNTVRKRRKVENQEIKTTSNNVFNEDQELLSKAIKMARKKKQENNILSMIKQQEQNQNNQKVNYSQIQMNLVNYKQNTDKKDKEIYNITDAAKGTTSCLNVHLPSQKIILKNQQSHMPESMKQITKQQLQKMKQQISFLQQQQMATGLTGTLNFLRQNNLLNKQQQFGRTNDKQSHHNQPGDRIKLEYRNASGKLMKPKQAFRYMSAIFHGQGPGKNKIQKIKKKELLEMRIKQAASGPGKLMNLLQKHQEKSGEAHMFIQMGSKNKEQ